jgi:hypothetical protein
MFRKCFTCDRKFKWCRTGIYRDSSQLSRKIYKLNKVIFEEFGESGICE